MIVKLPALQAKRAEPADSARNPFQFGARRVDHDVRVARSAFGDAAIAGFFAAGEIGPVAGRNHLHGFTASVLAFP